MTVPPAGQVRRPGVARLRPAAVAAVLALMAAAAGAQAQVPQVPQVPQPPQLPAQGSIPPAVDPATPGTPAPPTPGYSPGFIDAFGRWVQESTAGFNANLNAAWGALPGRGMSDAATNAAKGTADAAKGAAEATQGAASAVGKATQGAASAMGSVARDTAGALVRLPGARIVAGRERCPVAPNGAPDCRAAAEALCRANGLPGGASVDFETAEVCPSAALMARWRGEEVACATENYVTRSLCQ